MKLLPLILLVFITCWTEATKFVASGSIQCDMPGQTWCFVLTLIEIDIFYDDLLAATGTQCTSNKSWPYHLEGKDYDDGVFDNAYEVGLHVKHNCTTHGGMYDLLHDAGTYPIYIEKISVEWSPVLNDKGNHFISESYRSFVFD
uniref:Uncharacterized protein n=2 Tax=Caenorhabditis japonica TaxID=281687 RepID=A0A8R1HW09_CAEJA